MKTTTGVVLLAILVIGKNSADSLESFPGSMQRPGDCPTIPPNYIGACEDNCIADELCPEQMKCCSNGCGQDCTLAVFETSDSP
ncbi:WAP four-disulfide core domain protein 18-like [Mesocricetus auratus]|uniref:WAP four-disulfide core domain protein 18-like n=1 Tax=Mesocricetus auratus TaxID=10036 RepID=A0ABM2XRN7_MESAU|nr:WAP four-disulfide core domain protein 18-like [Mesocricetus auratus]